MIRKSIAFLLTFIMIISASAFSVFAESGDYVFDQSYYGDYSVKTEIGGESFNAGDFVMSFKFNHLNWLGQEKPLEDTFRVKTGLQTVDLNEKIPNLRKLAVSERLSQVALVGYVFNCSNIGAYSDDGSYSWTQYYNDPVAKIRAAMTALSHYITVTSGKNEIVDDKSIGPWTDSKMYIAGGSWFQLGDNIITFTDNCTVDELYDGVRHPDAFSASFAYAMNGINKKIKLSKATDDKIAALITTGSFFQTAGKRFNAADDISIDLTSSYAVSGASLDAMASALSTAKVPKTTERWGNNTCDEEAIFEALFGIINELAGAASESDASIVVCGGETAEVTDDQTAPEDDLAAEITICDHRKTHPEGAKEATVVAAGYTGDNVCDLCGAVASRGEEIPKLPSSIKLAYTSLKLKVKQSTSAEKVTFLEGDSIKSVKSSNTKIVAASKSGTNVIKLKAGSKTGKATVTVTLASGKSAKATVTVQKGDVACTGIKVTSGTTVKLNKGKTHQIKVTRTPVTCVQKITYKTSNKKIATVTSKGKVKGVKKGTAKITIKCGKKSKTVKIVVK